MTHCVITPSKTKFTLNSTQKNNNAEKMDKNKKESFYLTTLQIGEKIELFLIFRNGKMCITKRSKIGNDGFVCPRFLREINILKNLTNPPKYLENHPGRNNIIKLLDVYVED